MRRVFLIIVFLVLGSGCATTPPKSPLEDKFVLPRTGNFDQKTGVYKNSEIGFKLWFPSGYDVWTEESVLRKWDKQEGSKGRSLFLAQNEREAIGIVTMGIKISMELNDFVYLWKASLDPSLKETSSQEKQIGGMRYIELIYSGSMKDPSLDKEIDTTSHLYCFDLRNYKVIFVFMTLTRSYNQRKVDQINEIVNSFEQTR